MTHSWTVRRGTARRAHHPRATPKAPIPEDMRRRNPIEPKRKTLRICVLWSLLFALPISAQDKSEHAKGAHLDAEGNVYVSSDEGKLIKMAGSNHCSWVEVASDDQTVGCLVMRGLEPELFSQSLQLEIFLRGGNRRTIEPGAPIRDWHFLKDGQQVSLYFGPPNEPGAFALYDVASGRLIERIPEPSDGGLLPQWAKTRDQLQDESVPMSPALKREPTKWIASVLRQIGKVKPGMQRKDLHGIFTTEGGLSNRFQRTYVSVQCPYIKVDVRFDAANDHRNALKEDPEDIIESISRPYLAWGVAD